MMCRLLVKWWIFFVFFFFSSRRRHTRLQGDWSSDVCSSDLVFENLAVWWKDLDESRPGAAADRDQQFAVWFRKERAGRLRRLVVPLAGWCRRSEEHTSELQSPCNLVCRLLLEKKNNATSVTT